MDNVIAYEIKAPLRPGTGDLEPACDCVTSLTLMLDAPITYGKLFSYLQRIIGQFRRHDPCQQPMFHHPSVLEVDLCDFS